MIDLKPFGEVIIELGYIASYGWIMSFLMPIKIAALMRTTTLMGCLQIIAENLVKITS